MSLDRSLRTASGLEFHRSVLTRAEKVKRLMELGKFDMEKGDDPLGLPKVNNRKVIIGGKSKKKSEDEGE